jgi:hypothetical protein
METFLHPAPAGSTLLYAAAAARVSLKGSTGSINLLINKGPLKVSMIGIMLKMQPLLLSILTHPFGLILLLAAVLHRR